MDIGLLTLNYHPIIHMDSKNKKKEAKSNEQRVIRFFSESSH